MSDYSRPQYPQPHGTSSKRLVILIVAGFIVVNAIGYLTYRSIKSRETVAARPVEATTASDERVRMYRAAGLQAFEDGDYDLAVNKLSEAAKLGGSGDIAELLQMAKEMQEWKAMRGGERVASASADPRDPDSDKNKAGEPGEPEGSPAVPSEEPQANEEEAGEAAQQADKAPPEPAEPAAAKKTPPRPQPNVRKKRVTPPRPAPERVAAAATQRDKPAAEPAPEDKEEPEEELKKEEEPGILLVTSTPSKMVVMVDGKQLDVTPAKISMPAGTYRIAFSHEGQVLFSKTVTLKAGEVTPVNSDVSVKLAALQTTTRRDTEAVSPPPQPVRPPPPKEEPKAPKRDEVGELYILSPNVYGEVFVNGQSRGFPPLVVKNVPVGSAKVEIRVQGSTRRSKSVEVSKGERTQVLFR